MAESIVQDEDLNLLEHDDNEEGNIDSETLPKILDYGRSSTSRFSLPLRGGKQYHLFIAHSDTDKDYARRLMDELEDRFGFSCMYADRDFLPGKGIVENINEKVLQSQIMLLILTPDFKKSYYCNREMNEAFRLAEQENRFNTILPLLTRTEYAEDAIPMALRSLTYIDAYNEVDVAMKIHQMYCRLVESEQWPTDMDRGMDNIKKNGVVLLTACAEKYFPSKFRGIRWEFKELSRYQQRSLCQDDFEVCKIYKTTMEKLNGRRLLRMYGINATCFRAAIHGTLLGGICCFILLGSSTLIAVLEPLRFTDTESFILMIPLFTCFFAFIILFPHLLFIKSFVTEIDRCMWTFNKKILKESQYIVAFDWPKPDNPRINIIRYDSSKCHQYLCVLLKGMYPELSDAEVEEKVTRKIENLLWSKRKQIFYWNGLPTSSSNRHNVHLNKACFCEMVVAQFQEL